MEVYILKNTSWEHTYRDVIGIVQDETVITLTIRSVDGDTPTLIRIEKESVLLMTVEE